MITLQHRFSIANYQEIVKEFTPKQKLHLPENGCT